MPARLITALIRLRESWSATRQKLLEFDRHSETKCKVGEFVRSIFKTYVSAVKMHCPTQISNATTITLSHGEGGTLMRQLIRERIISKFESCNFPSLSDAAYLHDLEGRVAITTDSYVVSPLFFPGGDIGSLAVHGTVNDLSMMGVRPAYLTLALILEDGLQLETLDRVISSIARAASQCGVRIATGDTKVVPKGCADQIYINTTGIGTYMEEDQMSVKDLQVGDCLLVSGPIARHGLSVLAARESIAFSPLPTSDSAPLHCVATNLRRKLGKDLRAMRDATRGGIAAVLHEWAEETQHTMWFDEAKLPILNESRSVCELLGIDPLYVANEGTFVAAVANHRVEEALEVMRCHISLGTPSAIGYVKKRLQAAVLVSRGLGADQPLDEPIAAMLPRIC